MAILDPKNGILFVAFFDPHAVICACKIELDELLNSALSIKQFPNEREGVLIFDCQVVETLIVDTSRKTAVKLLDK